MTPFEETRLKPKTKKEMQEIAKKLGVPYKEVKDNFRRDEECDTFQNDTYMVMRFRNKSKNPELPDLIWLSIRKLDRSPVTDWREMQVIKNELIGPECEAVELYPAESRLVDTSNQFHMWGIDDPTYRFPFGFSSRAVTNTVAGGAEQRPHEDLKDDNDAYVLSHQYT